MAKKKSRSANVARKREKRNRDRKSKQKKLAAEKQRKPTFGPYGKMDDERLHALLLQTHELLEEPEIKKVHFDLEQMQGAMLKLFFHCMSEKEPTPDNQNIQPNTNAEDIVTYNKYGIELPMPDMEEVRERFCTEVLLSLMNKKFMRSLFFALNACENRFKQTGNREGAEVAFVAQALFEVVPPDIIVEHPLIEGIGIQTLRQLVENPLPSDIREPIVREFLSDLLEHNNSEHQDDQLSEMFSDKTVVEAVSAESEKETIETSDMFLSDNEPPNRVLPSKPDLETLPAKALYKNFDGLAIKDVLKGMNDNIFDNETANRLDYYTHDQKLCITVTENRIQLHAHSEEKLTDAMKNLESHCQSAIMYLAKTYEEGGKTDATE